MHSGDTIIATASAPGRAARALIRISGPQTFALLNRVCQLPITERLGRNQLRISDQHWLPVLVVTSRRPRSYTGEDAAELLLPGNPFLVDRVSALLSSVPGVRLATPGEFTARAFMNGKLTLDQAEGVAATIAARTDAELQAAASLLDGSTGHRYRGWAEEIATLLALVEAGIDFTDQEDVVAITPTELARRVRSVITDIESRTGASTGNEARNDLPRVVLCGRPNAGKSTLFNALLGRERAVVSPIAGTTRDVIEEPCDFSRDVPGASGVLLADLAGLEAPGTKIDAAAQQRAITAVSSADVVIHCDPTGRFDPIATRGTVIRVRTKADQGGEQNDGLPVCALDGWNLPVLRRAIAESAFARDRTARVIPRHARALRETRAQLERVMSDGKTSELAAQSLRLALDSIGDVTGRISPDDVIGRIFSTFCIGK